MKIANKFGNNRQTRTIMFVILLLLMISCSLAKPKAEVEASKFPNDPRVDRSFVTGQPCEAPCWYGLKINESTIEDIRETLPNLPFANKDQIYEQPTGDFGPDEIWFTVPCVYSKTFENCADLETFSNGKLRRIILRIDYELPLRLVIQKLGTPEYYTANPSPNSDICSLEIYWPKKDIGAVIHDSPRAKHCSNDKSEQLDLDLQVASLVYREISTENQQDAERIPWATSVP